MYGECVNGIWWWGVNGECVGSVHVSIFTYNTHVCFECMLYILYAHIHRLHTQWMAVCIALAAGLAVFLLVWYVHVCVFACMVCICVCFCSYILHNHLIYIYTGINTTTNRLLGVPLLRRNLPSRQQHKPVYTAAPLSTVHEDESWGQHEYEHGQQEQGEYVQTGAQEETPLHEKESVDGGIARSTPRSTPMFDFGAIPSPVRSASRSMPSKLTLHEILSMQQQEGQASTSTHSTALHHGQHDGQHDGQPHATPQRGSIDARGHTSASDDGHPSSSGGDGGITRSSGGGITRSSGGDITNSSGNSSLRHKSLAQLHSLWKAYSQLQYSQLQSREQAEQGVGSMDEEYTNDDDNDENDEIKGEEGTGVHGGGAWSGGGSVLEGDAQQTSTSTSV